MKNSRKVSRNLSPEPEPNEETSSDLTGGQIAGIVLMSLGGVGLLVLLIIWLVNMQKKNKKVSFMRFQNFIRSY